MAISKDQIIEAAEKLSISGTKPTMAAVREELGGGSFATISPVLKEWRDSRDERAVVALDMPAEAKAALDRAGADIWGIVTSLATEKLEKVSADADEAVSAANADRDEALAEIERLEALVSERADDNKKVTEELKEESTRLEASKEAIHLFEIQVAEKEHVETDNLALSKEVQALKSEVKEFSTEKVELSGTIKDLEYRVADCDKVKTELAAASKDISTLADQNKSLGMQVDKQQLALDMSDNQAKELKSELAASKKALSKHDELKGELKAFKEQSALFSSYQLLVKKVDEQA